MNATIRRIALCAAMLWTVGCTEHDRQPIATPPIGSDTLFTVPPEYAGASVRFADIDGDGWRDALVVVRFTLRGGRNESDSLIVYRFDPHAARHLRSSQYGDFGLYDATVIRHRSVGSPIIVAWLDGGGNDAVTYGKILLVWRNGRLEKIADAPWGDPSLIELDSLLVLEIHQTYSGTLPHAQALEYADSLIAVGTTLPYRELLDRRIVQYRQQLDSLWNEHRRGIAIAWDDVASKIMSYVNLESKRSSVASARAMLLHERRRWNRHLPQQYRQLLDDFTESFGEEFSFIR